MKKYLLIAAALLTAFAFVSCNKDEEVEKEKEEQGGEQGGGQEVEAASICINEVNGVKGYKGIEIYNPGDKAVDLKDWSIKKNDEVDDADAATSLYWKGIEGCSVPAKGFYVIHASKDDGNLPEKTEGCVATGGLSNKKAVKLELINPEGKTVDTFNRGYDSSAEAPEVSLDELAGSFARETDGAAAWKLMEPTFGATNNGAALVGDGVITGM